MLALNSDPMLCIWAYIFLSYSLFHLLSLLAPILLPISLYHNFPMLFFQFYSILRLSSMLVLVFQNSWVILTMKFPCPKLRLRKAPERNLKPAYSKSGRVWSHKKHSLLLGNIGKFLPGSAISTSPLSKSFLSSGAGHVPKEARKEKDPVQVVKLCIHWTKDPITTHSFNCLKYARISLKIISGLWC